MIKVVPWKCVCESNFHRHILDLSVCSSLLRLFFLREFIIFFGIFLTDVAEKLYYE